MAEKKIVKEPKHSKSEVVSIRMNPRIRFGLELMARQQRRSLTGVIEWLIDQALQDEDGCLMRNRCKGLILRQPTNLLDEVWDPDESERFVRLAIFAPQLLTYEEESLWKELKSNYEMWFKNADWREVQKEVQHQKDNTDDPNFDEVHNTWILISDAFKFKFLKEVWPECKEYLNGQLMDKELFVKIKKAYTQAEDLLGAENIDLYYS